MSMLDRYVPVKRSLLVPVIILSIYLLPALQVSAQTNAMSAPMILTPPAPEVPRINGARVFGVRPNSPFLYIIPATGQRPMTFGAESLPAGLTVDTQSGRISGALKEAGEYRVTLRARNGRGEATRILRIIVGDKIALTPPLGWNSWNCWGDDVSQEKTLAAARAFVEKGLIQHGWAYINIDDGWQGMRGGAYNAIQPNRKFPDMKGLVDQIHAMGLKAGIYSTPWRGAYSGHIGSSSDNEDGSYDWIKAGNCDDTFEYPKDRKNCHRKDHYAFGKYSFIKQDVRQWSDWGIDYLKYDWNPVRVPEIKTMYEALQAAPRDIVFSLSNGIYFNWAAEYPAIANLWRTSGDIIDTWDSVKGIGFNRGKWGTVAALGNDKWAPYVGPGHYIDPDMLVVGHVGWGKPHPTRLTPDEQCAHVSLWCLLSAPLILGCDPGKLDDFTVSLLTNDEVLDVDQDPLCKQAVMIAGSDQRPVYAKPLEDGSWAVGLFNLGSVEDTVTVRWSDLRLAGKQVVRDLWRQKDVGTYEDHFPVKVAPHGVALVRVAPLK